MRKILRSFLQNVKGFNLLTFIGVLFLQGCVGTTVLQRTQEDESTPYPSLHDVPDKTEAPSPDKIQQDLETAQKRYEKSWP